MWTFWVRYLVWCSVYYPSGWAHWGAVNSAGYVVGREHVGDIADADIEGMFATNVLGAFGDKLRRSFHAYWRVQDSSP
jgi:hypothetical protein